MFFFSDLKPKRCSSGVEARLLQFWELGMSNMVEKLMWMDLQRGTALALSSRRLRNGYDRHDVVETQLQLGRVKDWIISHQLKTLELPYVLSNFPDIFSALTEGKS
ncbi:Uncharacterized protein Rs2_08253 [Raphanus sativus]|nr:Uncharacterized protein Rs2_08253 [Raphanus sativus]